MKRLFYATGLFTVLASTYAYGQTVTAQVPFDFQTGDTYMPAGKYVISESGSVLTIKGTSGIPAAMMLTLPASRPHKAPTSSLEFKRYRNDYFLSTIWSADSQEGRAVPKCKRQKALDRSLTFQKTDDIALRTNNLPAHDAR
jgi:hypothetical protein